MTFEEALAFLDDPKRYGSDTDPELIKEGLRAIGNPEESFRIIHLAGTNGKGSTGTFISRILLENGCRVGHFTSPHVVTFTERIRIDGKNCSEALFTEAAYELREAVNHLGRGEEIRAFTLQMYAALLSFQKAGVTHAVIEAGIGGSSDATNVLQSDVCVITPIGLDHMPRLGKNLAEIATDKAGIMKPNIPAVSALQKPEVREILRTTAQSKQSPIKFVQPKEISLSCSTPKGTAFIWKGNTYQTNLAGNYQTENAVLAILAVKEIFPDLSDDVVQRGLSKANLPGRRQLVRENPDIIVDGAHNQHAIEAFAKEVREKENTVGIIGMMVDKMNAEILVLWRSCFEELFIVPVDDVRSWLPETVKNMYFSNDSAVRTYSSLEEAIHSAVTLKKLSRLYIMGSFYLAGEALSYFAANEH